MRHGIFAAAVIALLVSGTPPAAAQSCILLNNCAKAPAPPRAPTPKAAPKPVPPRPRPRPATPRPGITPADFKNMQPGTPTEIFASDNPNLSVDSAASLTAAFLRNSQFRRNPGVATDAVGYAFFGLDVVASLDEQKAVFGYADVVVAWRGALWKFSTRDNARKFIADPSPYVPAYNGFCAYCLAINDVAAGSTVAVYHDQLFLFANDGVRDRWQEDPASFIKIANENFGKLNVSRAPPLPQDEFSKIVSQKLGR